MNYQDYSVRDFVMESRFNRWVKGNDAKENEFWERWLAEYPEKIAVVKEAREIILSLAADTDELQSDEMAQMWDKINARRRGKNPLKLQERAPSHANFYQPGNWQKMAATVTGLLLISVILFYLLKGWDTRHYETAYGDTQMILLPDSSTVVLNGNSTLFFQSDWNNAATREVWLEGEAYFSVKHTADHQKFIVHTSDNFNVEVIGTEFNVSKRSNATRVILNSGKVKLNIETDEAYQQVMMQPGELVEFKDNPLHYRKKEVNPGQYTSWKNNKIILDNTSLGEIIAILEETYGFDIDITDKQLLKQKGKGFIPTDDMDFLLEVLSETFNLKLTKNNKHIRIEPALRH